VAAFALPELTTTARGGALPQVVNRREDERLVRALVEARVDAAVVRVAHVADAGRAIGELDERLARIGAREERVDVDGLAQRAVAGDELALVERQQMRRERHAHRRAERRQLLVDLGHVAVAADAVGGDVLVGGHEVRRVRRRPAGARDAALGVDHRVVQPRRQRREREQRRRRVAARVGHDVGALDLRAPQLRQPVHRLADELGVRVRHVPVLVDLDEPQAEVGREVDDAHAALVQGRDDRGGGAVRVGDDRRVDLAVAVEIELLERHVHAVERIQLAQPHADVGAARHRGQLEARVALQDRGGERTGVARGAGDDDARHAARPPARRAARRRSDRAAARRPRR
jgi:hypothetical protein